MKRTESLMNKDLDGELSHSESVELDRSERTDPDLRRTRDAWQRATRALATIEPQAPRFPVDAWAHQIHVATRPSWSFAVALRRFADHVWRQRWPLSAAGLTAVAAVGLFYWAEQNEASSSSTAGLRVQAPKVAPVEVRVGSIETIDTDDAPVSIRF
ncbi:MAG: hypothetical protein AAF449_05990 [Myxococcota bacterium]